MSSAIQDMRIVVSGGVTLDEYSKRLTDARLKLGGTEALQQAVEKFQNPSNKDLANQACLHLALAIDAYTDAKQFFGDRHKEDIDEFNVDYRVGEDRFLPLKEKYHLAAPPVAIDYSHSDDPTIASLGKFYWKDDVLQALWKAASNDEQAANEAILKLEQAQGR
jgi:hypothetical protein